MPADEYIRALDSEWSTRHGDSEFELETLYFGGGTPSKLGGEGVARLMDVVRRRARLWDAAEVTLEANPEDVSLESARSWRASGINRVSLGVQSFSDPALVWMHRTHDADAARSAIEVLREVGISNISIDLIFALPSTVAREWEKDLEVALSFDLPHISVYGLTVEPHTPLGRWVARRDVSEAAEESFEADYLRAHESLSASGYDHYEVSNYGKPGFHSRHNWAYWRRKPYGGMGPSAHEFDGARRRWNASGYAGWVSRVSRNEDPRDGVEELAWEQTVAEEVYLNLRTSAGMPIDFAEHDHIARLIDAGWAALARDSTLRLTGEGWLRLDTIASDLTLLRSR